jgi:hypothetical protein
MQEHKEYREAKPAHEIGAKRKNSARFRSPISFQNSSSSSSEQLTGARCSAREGAWNRIKFQKMPGRMRWLRSIRKSDALAPTKDMWELQQSHKT